MAEIFAIFFCFWLFFIFVSSLLIDELFTLTNNSPKVPVPTILQSASFMISVGRWLFAKACSLKYIFTTPLVFGYLLNAFSK